jgi:hypothetical protein
LRVDRNNHSISSHDLCERLGAEATPIVIDVRRDADFSDAERLLAPAFHRSPDRIEDWRQELPSGRTVAAAGA